jgi:hypothetical protein
MAKYRVLVVDDEIASTRILFENLFKGDPDFSMDTAESWDEFHKKDYKILMRFFWMLILIIGVKNYRMHSKLLKENVLWFW